MSKQTLVQVKIIETGRIQVAQQELPGMDKSFDSVIFEREHLKGTTTLELAINAAMGSLTEVYKKNHLEIRVSNSKENRWETVFSEQGQSAQNPDEYVEQTDNGKNSGDNGDGQEHETKARKKDREKAERKVVALSKQG